MKVICSIVLLLTAARPSATQPGTGVAVTGVVQDADGMPVTVHTSRPDAKSYAIILP